MGVLSPTKPPRIAKHVPKAPPRRAQEAPDGRQEAPKRAQHTPKRAPKQSPKDSKTTFKRRRRKPQNRRRSRLKSLIFKMTQLENQSKIARGVADEAPRSPEGAKMSPKESPKGAQRRFTTIGATVDQPTLAPGGPQGRPRARGVYLINQIIINKILINRFVDEMKVVYTSS